MLFFTAAVLPGTPIARQAPLAAISIVARAAADENDDRDGFMELSSPPVPTPTAAPLIVKLVAKKAPIPTGPVTYVPILYYPVSYTHLTLPTICSV